MCARKCTHKHNYTQVRTYVHRNLPKTELLLHGNLHLFESPLSIRGKHWKFASNKWIIVKGETKINCKFKSAFIILYSCGFVLYCVSWNLSQRKFSFDKKNVPNRNWSDIGMKKWQRHRDRGIELRKKKEKKHRRKPNKLFWHSEDRASWYILIIKANEMHYSSNFLIKSSTCFGQIYCPSSGVLTLYKQLQLFVMLVMLTVC